MTVSSDPVTPDEEAHREAMAAQDAHYEAELVQLEADVLEALAERDAALAELAEATRELNEFRRQRAELQRRMGHEWDQFFQGLTDPAHQPSRPKDRPRFAGEDHDDYALRGE